MSDQTLAQIAIDRYFVTARRQVVEASKSHPEVALSLMDLHQQIKDLVGRIEGGEFGRLEKLTEDLSTAEHDEPDDPAAGR